MKPDVMSTFSSPRAAALLCMISFLLFCTAPAAAEGPDKLAVGLFKLESLKNAGKAATPEFQKTLETVNPLLDKAVKKAPHGGAMSVFRQLVRFSDITGLHARGITPYMNQLNRILQEKSEGVMKGETAVITNWGILSSYRGGRGISLKLVDIDEGYLMVWKRKAGGFIPWRFYYVDKQGTRNIYEHNGTVFTCRFTRRAIKLRHEGRVHVVKVLVPRGINSPTTVPATIGGAILAVTLDTFGKPVAAEPVSLGVDLPAELENTSSTSSFSIRGNGAVPLDPNQPVTPFTWVAHGDIPKIKGLLIQAGMPDNIASLLTANTIKPEDSIYITGSTIFKGKEKDFKKGNYTVAGFNRWNHGTPTAYVAEYRGGVLSFVNMGDGSVYDGFGEHSFKLTRRLEAPERTYVCLFAPDGAPREALLFLNDLEARLTYDNRGVVKGQALKALFIRQDGSGGKGRAGYTAANLQDMSYRLLLTGTTFDLRSSTLGLELTNNKNGNSELYSVMGDRVTGLDEERMQMVVRFSQGRQLTPYVIARYGASTPKVLVVDRTPAIFSGVLYTGDDGKLVVQVTQGTVFGTVEKTWKIIYPK